MIELTHDALASLKDLLCRPFERMEFVTLAKMDWPSGCTAAEKGRLREEFIGTFRRFFAELVTAWGKPDFIGAYYKRKFPVWSENLSEAAYWKHGDRLAYLLLSGTGPIPDRSAYISAYVSPFGWLKDGKTWQSADDLTDFERLFFSQRAYNESNFQYDFDQLIANTKPEFNDADKLKLSLETLRTGFQHFLFGAFQQTISEHTRNWPGEPIPALEFLDRYEQLFWTDRQKLYPSQQTGDYFFNLVCTPLGHYVSNQALARMVRKSKRKTKHKRPRPVLIPGLVLHQSYSLEEILAAVGSDRDVLYDEQFIVTPTTVVMLGTIGDSGSGWTIRNPNSVRWIPTRLDYEPTDEYPYFPDRVFPVADKKTTQIFLRQPSDEFFCYAGEKWGGSRDHGVKIKTADLDLSAKLPYQPWVHLGGYPEWLIAINGKEKRLKKKDANEFRRLVKEEPSANICWIGVQRYEQDFFRVLLNEHRGWLQYQKVNHYARPGLHSWDPDYYGPAKAIEYLGNDGQCDVIYPARHTVPRNLAIQAAVEYMKTGQLPTCIRWTRFRGA